MGKPVGAVEHTIRPVAANKTSHAGGPVWVAAVVLSVQELAARPAAGFNKLSCDYLRRIVLTKPMLELRLGDFRCLIPRRA